MFWIPSNLTQYLFRSLLKNPAVNGYSEDKEIDVFGESKITTGDNSLVEIMASLDADNRSIIIKPVDKGLCIVVWDRMDYMAEAEKQLSDSIMYILRLSVVEKILLSS